MPSAQGRVGGDRPKNVPPAIEMFLSPIQQNRLLAGSPLRRRSFALSTAAIILVLLAFAILTFSFLLALGAVQQLYL